MDRPEGQPSGSSTSPDVLVVAPYNAQVAEIASLAQQRLGVLPNVGTVDKFQGREAPVAIYSMTTSSPEDAPRDIEFLYSGNRLNVAISRARGLAVLVASPELLRVACRTPEQMRLVNAFCRYIEIAAEQERPTTNGPMVVAPISASEAGGPAHIGSLSLRHAPHRRARDASRALPAPTG